jgi:hypothetical protein
MDLLRAVHSRFTATCCELYVVSNHVAIGTCCLNLCATMGAMTCAICMMCVYEIAVVVLKTVTTRCGPTEVHGGRHVAVNLRSHLSFSSTAPAARKKNESSETINKWWWRVGGSQIPATPPEIASFPSPSLPFPPATEISPSRGTSGIPPPPPLRPAFLLHARSASA